MEKQESFFDKLAREQTATRSLAASAIKMWNQMDKMPQPELIRLFKAINQYPEYDPNMHYRKKALRVIRDEYLPELIGVSAPVCLAWEIERRLWIVEKEPPPPPLAGNVDIEEITDR